MKRFLPLSFANETSRRLPSSEILHFASATVWLFLVALGLGFLMRYANAPGEQGEALSLWPAESGIPRSDSKPTLLVFAHPKCPCTGATLEELSWVMDQCQDTVDCRVLFFHAQGEGPEWVKTKNWRAAADIDGVNVVSDPQSRSASRFGVKTSGHTLLYDADGQLLFEGGITPARGHRGDNVGRASLLALIRQSSMGSVTSTETGSPVNSTCVFGCPLQPPEAEPHRWPTNREG